jgi:hypothetical protein
LTFSYPLQKVLLEITQTDRNGSLIISLDAVQ